MTLQNKKTVATNTKNTVTLRPKLVQHVLKVKANKMLRSPGTFRP